MKEDTQYIITVDKLVRKSKQSGKQDRQVDKTGRKSRQTGRQDIRLD